MMSSAHAILNIPVLTAPKGSLPAKIDILDEDENVLGKVFIEYEILKTEVTYLVEKLIDYTYMLKFTNFKVNFLRNLKKVPNLYLKFNYGKGKIHR